MVSSTTDGVTAKAHNIFQAQTPTQKRANLKYANQQESKMGAFRPPKVDRETRRKMELSDKFKKSGIQRWVVCEF